MPLSPADDISRLSTALQAADAAGDTAAAQQLAGALRSAMSAQPSVMTPPSTGVDAAKGIGSGLAEGVIGSTAGFPGDISQLAPDTSSNVVRGLFGPGVGDVLNSDLQHLSTSQISKTLGTDYDPQTLAGKRAKSVAGGVGGMAVGGLAGLAKRLLIGAGIGAAGQVGDEAAGPGGRVGASGAAGILPLLLSLRTPNVVRATKDLLGDLSPDALKRAGAVRGETEATLGTPVLLSQALPQSDALTALVREVAANPAAGQKLRTTVSPQAKIGNDKLDELISAMSQRDQGQVGDNLNLAAGADAIGAAEKARTDFSRPLYDKAGDDVMTPQAIADMLIKMDQKRDALNLGATTDSGKTMQSAQEAIAGATKGGTRSVPVKEVDRFRQEALEKASAPVGAATGPAGGSIADSLGQKTIAQAVKEATNEASPALKAGQQNQAFATRAFVDPMQRSSMTSMFPIGDQMAKKGNLESMVSVLGKDLDNTKDIHFVAEHLAAADPEAFPSIVQKWLTKETGASRTLQGGREAPTSLNDFLSNVYGVSGSNKRQNFGATMEGVALSQGKDPAAVRTGAEKLLDALQVVSRDRELASGVDTSAVKQAAQGTAVAEGAKMVGLAIGKPFGRALDRVMFQRTYKQIADALTSPNGVAELEALAKYDPSGEKAKSIVLNILRASGMAQGEK